MSPRVSLAPNPPGTAFARFIKSLPLGAAYAESQFPDTPNVAVALQAKAMHVIKGAVAGMTTSNQPDLAALGVIDPALALLLAGQSAFEACRVRGMRELPFDIPVPRQTDAGTGGGWIDEGLPAPVIKAGLFDEVRLQPIVLGSIFCLTNEVLRRAGTETLVRNTALATQGRVETFNFLDPSVAASGKAPASITHGATEIAWTGNAADLLGFLLSAISTPATGLALIARPLDLALLAARLGSAANLPGSLLGVPVVPAPNAPAGLVVLADLPEIACASTTVEVDVSEEASLEMSDTPTNSPAAGSPEAPVATSLVSLWQANSTAYKIWRFANWAVREGAVAYSVIAGSPA